MSVRGGRRGDRALLGWAAGLLTLALVVAAALAPAGRAGGGPGDDVGSSVAIQPDGKIVVAGTSHQGPGKLGDFAIARYMPNGSLDPSFAGGDGRRTFGFSNGANTDAAGSVAIQPDGKMVVAGNSQQSGTGTDFAVARLNPGGDLDQSFAAGDGKRTFGFANGAGSDVADGVAIQANGKIVVAGYSQQSGTGSDFAVARLNPGGGLDQGFSGDGRRTTTFGPGSDEGNSLAIQANGRIVIAGDANLDPGAFTEKGFAIARYMPGGGLDQSFAGDGKRTIVFPDGTGTDTGFDMAIQSNGRIVIAGESNRQSGGSDFALARLMANGNLDPSLSGDGKRTTTFGPSFDRANGVLIQPNGRIVVAGHSGQPGTQNDFAIARYLSNGDLDQSFAGDGKRLTVFGPGPDVGNDVAIQPNGRLVMVGDSLQSGTADFAVARYLSNGSLDPSFSGNGKQTTSF